MLLPLTDDPSQSRAFKLSPLSTTASFPVDTSSASPLDVVDETDEEEDCTVSDDDEFVKNSLPELDESLPEISLSVVMIAAASEAENVAASPGTVEI